MFSSKIDKLNKEPNLLQKLASRGHQLVNLRPINKDKLPLIIMVKTPIKHETSPIILRKFIFSLKNRLEIMIINIGEDEYIIPMLVTIVV